MLTVRYPNGQKLRFNNAHHLLYSETEWCLYESEKQKKLIAIIQPSAGVIVEFVSPCFVEKENIELTKRRAFEMVERILAKGLPSEGCGRLTANIKRHLRRFNMQTQRWS
jgi:hypothetical protein